MNPRQRRGILFIGAAVVLAVAVFIAVNSYVARVDSQVGPKITVYEVSQGIKAYQPLGADNLQAKEVPRRWAASTAVNSLKDLSGRRVSFPLNTGTVITSDMLIPSSDLNPDEREIAISVDSVTGVAGRVRTGDRVDIYATFSDVPGLPKQTRALVQNVRVVSIGSLRTQSDKSGNQNTVVPVTLALDPQDSLAVTYANAFAEEVRLVALPTDVGTNRKDEVQSFDAQDLGGTAVPEGEQQ